MIGKQPYRLATASSCAERWRICHSGVRWPARRRGQQQRPRRVLAEAAREQRRPAERADDQLLDVLRARIAHRVLDGGDRAGATGPIAA